MTGQGPLTFDYAPPGPVVREFLMSDAEVSGIMGPYGSGKSTACIARILRHTAQQRPSPNGKRMTRWAVIRNTHPELKTTTIKSWLQWLPKDLGYWKEAGPTTHHIITDDLDMEVWFLALDKPDDVAKLGSLEITGAWQNEVREQPKAILDALTGRVGRYPPALLGGCTWSGVLMDTNPPDSDSWYYKLAEEPPDGYRFFKQPSGLAPDAENLDWLNQDGDSIKLPLGSRARRLRGREYYVKLAKGKTDDWANVYVRGNYGFAIDGKPIFPEYFDNVHCREVEPNPHLPLHIGIDFGLTPAAIFAQRSVMGQWRWIDELVTEDMGAVRFAELLGAMIRGTYGRFTIGSITGDPAGEQRVQTDERTPFDILAAHKIHARPAHTNDFTLRREAVAQPMTRLIDGQPGFLISPKCKITRKGLAGGYAFRRLQVAGQERFRDVPDKNAYSHPCEAGQYAMLGGGEGKRVIRKSRDPGATRTVVPTSFDMLA